MNKEIEIPNCAGETPASTNEPQTWRPVIEIPSEPESIPMPPELVSNQAGAYPNQKPS